MSTLFVLLGVIFLGGGIASIVDGYPYMVLERGFTQVIVGSVAVVAGVLLLALSRVMAELKQLRMTLSNAVMAVSVASLAAEPPALSISRAGDRDLDGPSTDKGGSGTGLSGAAVGAVAGAGAAVIAGRMLARDELRHDPLPQSETAPEGASFEQALAATSSSGDDADLFEKTDAEGAKAEVDQPDMSGLDRHDDALPAAAMADLGTSQETADEPPIVASASIAPADDIRDPFSDALLAPTAPAVAEHAAAEDASDAFHSHETVEPPRKSEPDFDTLLAWPEPEPYKPMVSALRSEPRDDAFGSLRDDLADRPGDRNQAADIPARDDGRRQGGKIEAAESWMAESWMDRPAARREPWFAEPPVQPPAVDSDETAPVVAEMPLPPDLQLPPWPTLKRGSAPAEKAHVPEWPTLDRDRELDAAIEAAEPEARDAPAPAEEISPVLPDDIAAHSEPEPDEVADVAPPAASNEGIVGAYQVGDANFTIYADGSIKARTPDGDYNFGSMDELKTYLASEKSRLGV